MIAFAVYVQQVIARFRVGTICFLAEIKTIKINKSLDCSTTVQPRMRRTSRVIVEKR